MERKVVRKEVSDCLVSSHSTWKGEPQWDLRESLPEEKQAPSAGRKRLFRIPASCYPLFTENE
jgi:hypothetical protein